MPHKNNVFESVYEQFKNGGGGVEGRVEDIIDFSGTFCQKTKKDSDRF